MNPKCVRTPEQVMRQAIIKELTESNAIGRAELMGLGATPWQYLPPVSLEEDFEYCDECNNPLSCCGPQNVDGTPSMDCKVCQLKDMLEDERKAHSTTIINHQQLLSRLETALMKLRFDIGDGLHSGVLKYNLQGYIDNVISIFLRQ